MLSWLGLWLASWLMLLSLCALAWIYIKRRFGPDARLFRAARAGSRKGEFGLEHQPVVSLRDGSAGKFEARPSALDDSTQQGARQIVYQAIEAELAALPKRYDSVETLNGRGTMIRNGYLPERKNVSVVGPVTVMVPKVRDRSGSGVKFNSNIVPPYIRKSARAWLYLGGVSTGDMSGVEMQQRVMQVARRLAESGERVLGKPGKAYD